MRHTGDIYRDFRQRRSLAAFLAATPLGQAVLADHKGLQMLITAAALVPSLMASVTEAGVAAVYR